MPPSRRSPRPDACSVAAGCDVEAHVARVLASPQFRRSQRRSDLLRWAIERALNGRTEAVKEYQIGREVFGKSEDWDPRVDPIVRVEFNRIRQKLREYYESTGAQEAVAVEFPAGSYVPVIAMRMPHAEDTPEDTLAPVRQKSHSHLKIWALIGAASLLAAGAIVFWSSRRTQAAAPPTTVAVLPFLDLMPGGQHQYLSDGFTDELTDSLAMFPDLRVISRTSAFQFKGKSFDIRKVGGELGAGAVVEGSILGQGGRIRVIVQLDRTSDGTHLWQAQYDRDAKDLLGVEDEIAQAVAQSLHVRLTGAPAKEFDPGPEAFNEYIQGIYEERKSSPAALRAAMRHYENAVRLAPRYALAYVRLASVHLAQSGLTGPAQKTELERARGNLETALSIEPKSGVAVAALALVDYVLHWDARSAEAGFRRALALSGGASATHQLYAWFLMTRGRFAESERHYREAIQLDPLNPLLHYNLAVLFLKSGRTAAAGAELEPLLQRDPAWFRGRLTMAYVALCEHRPAEALRQLQLAEQLAPKAADIDSLLVMAYAESGQRAKALALMRQMEAQDSDKGYIRYGLALASALLGDANRVFYWLGQSVDAHEQQALSMRIEPALARYQQDPRMLALERRTGLIQ